MYYDGDCGRFQFARGSGCVICGAILQRGCFFFFFFYVLFEGDAKTVVKKKLIQLPFFFNLKSANSLKISMMSCKA
jgi:hypothetical protein